MRQVAYNKNMAKKDRYNIERLFLALSNETRLTLLHLLGDREVCVCELVDALRQPQPKISQHLACLRSVGVVEARREGKWMHYRIVPPPHRRANMILQETLTWLKEEKPVSSATQYSSRGCTQKPVVLKKRGINEAANSVQS
jgi:ArsR family transcriptional regulator